MAQSVPKDKIPSRRESSSLADLPCVCAAARRTARALTQLYDDFLSPSGIKAAQFALLAFVASNPTLTQAEIGRALVIDKTTLSRNFQWMKRRGWLREQKGEDTRERRFSPTTKGRKLLADAMPRWSRVQQKIRARLREKSWRAMWENFQILTVAAVELQSEEDAR